MSNASLPSVSTARGLSTWRTKPETILAALFGLALVAGAAFASAFPFTSDGAIHAEMARAMGLKQSFAIAGDSGVAGAPPLLTISSHIHEGQVYAQYPAGYGVIAGPFYAAGGFRGLLVLNALAAAFALLATWRIAERLFNRETANLSVVLLGVATFFHNYAFAIWPHMLSLAALLGAAWAAVIAVDAQSTRGRFGFATLSGLIAGVGVTIRADLILAAPAIFLWMRLFALPGHRAPAAAFVAAVAPGLLLAAYFNQIKFGVFAPLYYGAKSTPDGVSRYLWLLPVIAGAGLACFAINAHSAMRWARGRFGARNLLVSGGVIAGAVLVLAYGRISDFLYSVFVLTIDLQGYNGDYVQPGVEHNEYGHLLFWGFPKRALLQSLPFAPLLLLPATGFFRGENMKAISVCLLFIAAPICFYSLNQWHGGGAYNMRYFLGAVPFIAMLSAMALNEIVSQATLERQFILAAIVAGAAAQIFANEISQSTPALFAPMALYPQLVLASLVALAAGLFVWRRTEILANAVLAIAAAAIAYAGMINLADFSAHEKSKAEQAAFSRTIADTVPADALILTSLPVLMPDAISRGVSVYFVDETRIDGAAAALTAFKNADRCVLIHNSLVRDFMASALSAGAIDPAPIFLAPVRFPAEARLEFYVLAEQMQRCAPGANDLN